MAWVLAIPITKASVANITIRFMVISNALVEDATPALTKSIQLSPALSPLLIQERS